MLAYVCFAVHVIASHPIALQDTDGKLHKASLRMSVWGAEAMRKRYALLVPIVRRLLGMHATSCSAERLWSRMRHTYRSNRSRLLIEKVYRRLLSKC